MSRKMLAKHVARLLYAAIMLAALLGAPLLLLLFVASRFQ